jgi:hypothetical protein
MKRLPILLVLIVAVTAVVIGQDRSMSVGDTIMGRLERGDQIYADTGGFMDWYSLRVTGGDRFSVMLSSSIFDTYLVVEMPDGSFLSDDDGGGGEWGTDSALTVVAASSGIARIGVRAFSSNDTGPYSLSVEYAQVGSLRVGQTAFGYLDGPEVIYILEGMPETAVEIELRSQDFDTYLELEDSDGNYYYNDDADGITVSRLSYVIGSSGTATITVSAYWGGSGDFELEAREIDVQMSALPDGYRLSDGETIQSTLVPTTSTYRNSYYQRFTFVAEAGERVEIIHRSDDFDCYLGVIDPTGREWTDDDGAGNLDSRLLITVENAGEHEVYAAALGSGHTGEYWLEFNRLGLAQILSSGSGELTRDDPHDVTRPYYYDIWRFSTPRGGSLMIDVTSDDFDGYAVVRDNRGDIVARDDDSGGSGNPRIEFYANAGMTYELVVTTFSYESFGRYSFTIYE